MRCVDCPAWYPIDEEEGYCEYREVRTLANSGCKHDREYIERMLKKRGSLGLRHLECGHAVVQFLHHYTEQDATRRRSSIAGVLPPALQMGQTQATK